MAIFKALYSPKQMITFQGQMFRAEQGVLTTQDKGLISALRENPSWDEIEVKKDIKTEATAVVEASDAPKKGRKKKD